jgi:hypothetical protein
MNPGTAFLLGFGACLIFWIASLMLGSQIEKGSTPEEACGLDPKRTPVRFWLLRTARFLFPSAVAFWIDMTRTRRKREASEKERDEGL